MSRGIRLLDSPTDLLRIHEVLVILRTLLGTDYPLAVKDCQYVCDLFLIAGRLFQVPFTRIHLSLGAVVLEGYEPIMNVALEDTQNVILVVIRDAEWGHEASPHPSPWGHFASPYPSP